MVFRVVQYPPRISTSCLKKSVAFTLLETLTAVAIIAALSVGLVMFVGSVVSAAQTNRDKQTLQVLNDALTRYKCGGGDINALTASVPISHVLTKLATTIDWNGLKHIVLKSGQTYRGGSISAKGTGSQYRFTRYHTYMAEEGGVSTVDLGSSGGSLVAWWKFDETNGAIAIDSAGGSNGTLLGTTLPTRVAGRLGNALQFDPAQSQYVSTPGVTIPGSFAISFWFKYTGALCNAYIMSQYGFKTTFGLYSTGYHRLSFNPNSAALSTGVLSSAFVNDGNWHHAVGVQDNSKSLATLYLDGQACGTASFTHSSISNGLSIGYSTSDGYFTGLIDDVRIYNRALSAAEVLQLYNQ